MIGLGELGLNPKELHRYTMQQFLYKVEGTRKHAWEQEKTQWEMIRALAYEHAVMQGKELKKGITLERYWPFSWDKKKGIAAISSAEERRMAYHDLRKRILSAAKESRN